MRSVVVLLGLLIALSLASQTVSACSCGGPGTPCESYGAADAVFVGTAVSVRDNQPPQPTNRNQIDWTPMAFKFSVEQSYLGVAGTEIEVFTGRGGGDCGFGFKMGQRYLVYAYRFENKLITGICTRTKSFSNAAEDIAFLGTLSSAAPGVTIYGSINHRDGKKESFSSGVLITIEGESNRREIRPDPQGRFRVSGLRAGKYKVSLRLPETLTASPLERELTVAERGCAAVAWYIADNGRIGGRVVNADGEAVARILVSLVEPGVDPKERFVGLERTDAEGRFSFSAVPEGRYLIAVNHNRFPKPNDPTNAYPPSFYPGVIDQALAHTITIGAGEKLNDVEVRVPSKRPDSVLTGTVVWSDGSPVEKAQVIVTDVTTYESSLAHGIEADQQGKFRLEGYAGQKLVIEARSNRPYVPSNGNGPMERSEKLRITLERPEHTLRIVITKLPARN